MTMIMGGRSFKLPYAFLTLFVLVHLRLALGRVIPGVGDANNISCPEGERQALLEFKKGISDPIGWLSFSWGSEDENKNCCNWLGIRCSNQTGHVVQLQLVVDFWGGMISPSLLELPYLTYLDLSNNNFNHSHIPEFIGSLSNLEHLDLSSSNLSGPIPRQFGNLSRLQYLHLGENNLTNSGNLEWLSHMSSIEDLDLSSTNLSGANDWLEVVSSLPNLKTLDMSACNLSLMSLSSFSQFNHSKSFTSLESLQLRDNEINDIPKFFGDICTLRELGLSWNNLNGQLIEYINDLFGCAKDSLEVLGLARNQLWGSLPDFAMFPSLKEIYLSFNKLNGTMPKTIGNLHNLEHLHVSFNYLQDVISEAHFSNLSKLLSLDLTGNSNLTLEFDFNWVPPFQLEELHLRSCKLGPRFPNWIRTQRNFTFLDISNAEISDTVPAEWFANLSPRLYSLDISSNQIHGQLPIVSTMSSHQPIFDLSANRLEGPLPLFSTNVTSLNLSKNRFSGPLSPLCKINDGGQLEFLDLSDNLLSGQLPNCFMDWPNLLILNLANNNFSGEVPSSFRFLSMLQTLSLHNNTFSGDFPNSLKNCSYLSVMDLGNNRFSEKIPAWIAEALPQLIVLILRSNKFSGSIPWDTCKLKYLRILDLSLNDISGTIPQCLNNFTAMAHKADSLTNLFEGFYSVVNEHNNHWYIGYYVDSAMVAWKGREYEFGKNLGYLKIINLSSNNLTGKLPTEITSLLGLVVLNVSKNNLIGEIPQTIGQLKQLESFDMSRNWFSGEIPSSMSELQFLSHLNLSFNNFSGKIPSGTQLQGFDTTCFIGNRALCGPPLKKKCPGEETPEETPNQSLPTDNGSTEDDEDNRDEFKKRFYVGAGIGFAVAFWGMCSSLILKRSWRHAYFLLLDNMKDWVYVTMAVNKARLWRMFQRQG